jgi:hypothetical protein
VHTVKENAKALIMGNKEIGLEVNPDKTKYMVMSRDQNAGRSHNMKTDNRSFLNSGRVVLNHLVLSGNHTYHQLYH